MGEEVDGVCSMRVDLCGLWALVWSSQDDVLSMTLGL